MEIIKISENIWEIPKTGDMLVPGRIYASDSLMLKIREDESLQQVRNVATLPGICNYSLAMPDIHEGYGFPIGGVAAVDRRDGYISPGGVGYDINCGVRLLKTSLFFNDVKVKIKDIAVHIFNAVPSGVGSKNAIKSISLKEFGKVLKKGAKWSVNNGYGTNEDIELTEERGCVENEGIEFISKRAVERGISQLGTLGSGNHFIEIDIADKIYDKHLCETLGIEKDMLLIMFHTGSRGFGYQVCDDFLNRIRKAKSKFQYSPPDTQLLACPFNSEEGIGYFNAMNAAANFAWANRQIIKELIERAIMNALNISPKSLGLAQIYDVSHNIAKIENDFIIHRKGAINAKPPFSKDIPSVYKRTGQPVIIPGDMCTGSYLLFPTEKVATETFSSACHGAGRALSRRKALKKFNANEIVLGMEKSGITVLAKSKRTIAEEVPEAYKNIDDVIMVMENCGLLKKAVRLKPVAVIKG